MVTALTSAAWRTPDRIKALHDPEARQAPESLASYCLRRTPDRKAERTEDQHHGETLPIQALQPVAPKRY